MCLRCGLFIILSELGQVVYTKTTVLFSVARLCRRGFVRWTDILRERWCHRGRLRASGTEITLLRLVPGTEKLRFFSLNGYQVIYNCCRMVLRLWRIVRVFTVKWFCGCEGQVRTKYAVMEWLCRYLMYIYVYWISAAYVERFFCSFIVFTCFVYLSCSHTSFPS